MDLKRRLQALEGVIGASGDVGDPIHDRVDEVLRRLATDDLAALARVLEGWESAGHATGSAPDLHGLKPDDTGNVIDSETMTLIATAEEWRVYERVLTPHWKNEDATTDQELVCRTGSRARLRRRGLRRRRGWTRGGSGRPGT